MLLHYPNINLNPLTHLTKENDYTKSKFNVTVSESKREILPKVVVSGYGAGKPQCPIVGYIQHYRNIYASPENFIKRRIDYEKMKVFDDKLRKGSERLKTFTKFPQHLSHLVKPIAKSGFYFIGNEEEPDKVKCIYCQGILHDWKKSDIPNKEHRKYFPTCPFLLNLNVGNESFDESFNKKLTIDHDLVSTKGEILYNVINGSLNEPLHMLEDLESNFEWRERTFDKFHHLAYLVWESLFIETKGNAHFLKCYKCLKKIEILEGVENLPLNTFHKPDCGHETGTVENSSTSNEDEFGDDTKNYCQVEYSVTDEEIDARMDSRKAHEMGRTFGNLEKIKSAIARKLKTTGTDYDSAIELLYELRDNNDSRTEEIVENSLEYIFHDLTCAVCLTNSVEIVFLPCGHLRTCSNCSNLLTVCAICRTVIEKKVRGVRFLHAHH